MAEESARDACECIWAHELAMRRLLNFIQNSQTTCTDSECFTNDICDQPTSNNVLLVTVMLLAAFFLYIYHPRNRRALTDGGQPKKGNGSTGSPPSPPPATL